MTWSDLPELSTLWHILSWWPLASIACGAFVLLLACASAMRHARMLGDALHDLYVDHSRVCTELVGLKADCTRLLVELELWESGLKALNIPEPPVGPMDGHHMNFPRFPD